MYRKSLAVLYDWDDVDRKIQTTTGKIDYPEWIFQEQERLRDAGRVVRVKARKNQVMLMANEFVCTEDCECEDCLRFWEYGGHR